MSYFFNYAKMRYNRNSVSEITQYKVNVTNTHWLPKLATISFFFICNQTGNNASKEANNKIESGTLTEAAKSKIHQVKLKTGFCLNISFRNFIHFQTYPQLVGIYEFLFVDLYVL